MTKIGATFAQELIDAGLPNVPMSWDAASGEIVFTGASDEQKAAVLAVLDAHDPTKMDMSSRAAQELAASDASLARGTEDLIAVLIARGVITWADLPAALRAKIEARQAWRQALVGI